MWKRNLLAALLFAALALSGYSHAADVGAAIPVGATKHVLSSTLTRIANGTAYAGTSTAPQAICLFTSATPCVPVSIPVSSVPVNNGNVTGVRLIKSTTGAISAQFAVLLYQQPPSLSGVFDTTVYTPKLADMANFVGYWSCTSQVVNGDNSTYDCTTNAPSGNQAFSVTDGTLRGVILAAASYAPGSSETFTLQVDALTTVP